MAGATTNANMDDVLTTYLNRRFVSDLEYALQYQKFTMKGDLPEESGNILRFNIFAAPLTTGYASGSTALTEGTTTEHEITSVTIAPTNLTMAEYGEFIKVNRLWEIASQPGTRDRLTKRLRDGGAVSLDTVVRTAANGTTSVVYATTAQVGGQTTGPATVGTLGASTLIFARKLAFDGLTKGFEGISGHPDMHWAAIITSKQELDVVTEVTTSRVYWSNAVVNVPGKMGQDKWVNGYIGSVYGTAVYVTQNYATAALTATSEVGYLLADGGLGAAAFGDMNARVVINDVNSPYKNVNSIAWHAMFTAALLENARVVKMYSIT